MPSSRMLPHRATLEPQTGTTGGLEPIYGPALEIRCLLVRGLREVEGPAEREEVVTDTAYCDGLAPGDIPTGSRFTCEGEAFVVVTARQFRHPDRPEMENVELHLGRGSTPEAPPP